MLAEVFYWLLNMSIVGTLVGALVLTLQKIKGLPAFVHYLLWTIPLVRLWIPFGFGSRYSLLNLISNTAIKTVIVFDQADLPKLSLMNSIMAAKDYFPIVYKTNLLERVFSAASIVWMILAVAALLASVILYSLTKHEMKSAEHYKDNIYFSEKILSPAIYGIVSPRVILPKNISKNDLPYILMHERVHIKRRDNLWRVVAVVTACVHWFNPFAWIFLKHFFADMELSCDARVLKILGEENKKEYATALVHCEENKAMFVSAFGGAKTRVRIENILSYSKLTALSAVCFISLIIILAIVLLTNSTL